MGMVIIGPLLQEKIRKESAWFPDRTPLLSYYLDCYFYDGDKKSSTGPGFLLHFKDGASLIEDPENLTIYQNVVLKTGMVCIVRMPRSLLPEHIRLEVVDRRISLFYH